MQFKLHQNANFGHLYADFLKEYEDLGHMIPISSEYSSSGYYLPHHGVLRESSSTTKLRVVFNGSSTTSSGLSLNHILHIAPKLLLDLANVITWWRQHRYVFSADIEKMFRQIRIHSDDCFYQRILWGTTLAKKSQHLHSQLSPMGWLQRHIWPSGSTPIGSG